MNKTEVEKFIEENLKLQIPELVLKLSKVDADTREFIVNQIHGRQKAATKYPFLLEYNRFIFPSSKAIAQSSSYQAAAYKSAIVAVDRVADLSGGMGLDSFYFSKIAKLVHYVEMNPKLAKTTLYNFKVLGVENIATHATSAEKFIEETEERFNLIYVDPDRRQSKEKAFRIEDCEPNVAELLLYIWEKSEYCLIKLSPMLDISQALGELKNCKEVHVVSVNNECKELLFLLKKNYLEEPRIFTTNLLKTKTENFSFFLSEEKELGIEIGEPQQYLYEPNSAVLKAGAFKSIAIAFKLKKLSSNTHLYTSNLLINNFPGRKIEIREISKPRKGLVGKANVVCRNFPLNPDEVKKKYKIKDGGNCFLYACSLEGGSKVFLLGEQIRT